MMGCVHLQKLYQLCAENQLKLSSSDLIHFVCEQCDRQEVCPSNLMEMDEHSKTDQVDAQDASVENLHSEQK